MWRREKADGEKGNGALQQAALALGLRTAGRRIESVCLNESVGVLVVGGAEVTTEIRLGRLAKVDPLYSYRVLCIHKFHQLSDKWTRASIAASLTLSDCPLPPSPSSRIRSGLGCLQSARSV